MLDIWTDTNFIPERRGPFEFTQQYTYDNQPDAVHLTEDPFDFKIKVEEFDFGCLYTNNNNNNNSINTIDDNIAAKCDTAQTDNYLVNQSVQDTIVSKGDISSFKETPMYNQKVSNELDYETSVIDLTNLMFGSNCDEFLMAQTKMDDSSSGSETGQRYPTLKLNITGKIIENTSTLSTPEVIQTIADIENDNFNILDIVNEKVTVCLI